MQNGTTVKTLVVDDDEDDLFLIKDALTQVEGTRYAISSASSPLMAMSLLSKDTFDVIFSDYRLGAVTGVDLINSIRAAGIDTPVILLTGMSDHFIDDEALKAGSSDFISKVSLNPEVLDRSVRYALAHANRQRLMQSILKNTKSGITVINAAGKETLTNAEMSRFAKLAFGDEPNAKQRLTELVIASDSKDIAIGSVVFESHVTKLPDGSSLLALHDVTDRVNDLRERERAEERVRAIAMEDALTGLPNRLAFNSYLDSHLAEAGKTGGKAAVLLFDFNRFKEVNDICGHAAGDYVLQQCAAALRQVLTGGEFCARLGGDEFVIIQENGDESSALALAQRVALSLNKTLKWEEKVIEASITLGIALYPQHGLDRHELLANADLALYRGKADQDRFIYIFDAKMDQEVRDKRDLLNDLRHAIDNNELSLDLQPQFVTESGKLAGFEALLRWNSPKRGRISPALFVPLAEENGLIIEIDKFVLRRACKLLAQYDWVPRLAVNISAKAICRSEIVAEVKSVLLETGLSPKRLELEVTETALVHDLNRALHNMRQIKALGIAIAMDDFGIGYSSLSLLSSFPFDRVKVDGSFIRPTGSNERADAIFKAIVGLGAALRVPILAEGVESEQHYLFAQSSGCEELQGFHFGKPVPEQWLPVLFKDLDGLFTLTNIKVWQTIKGPEAIDFQKSAPVAV